VPQKFLFSTALISASLANLAPAYADFTPTEALERYFETAEALGSAVSVNQKENFSGTVRWSGIVITDTSSGSRSTMDWLEVSPVDPDTVRVLIGPRVTVEARDPGNERPVTVFDIDMLNNQVIMTEEGVRLNASYSGDKITLTSVASYPDMPLDMNVTISELLAAYAFEGETYVEGSASSGEMEITYGLEDGEIAFSSDTSIASLNMSFSSDIPQDADYSGFLDGKQNGTVTYMFNDMSSRTSFNDGEGGAGWIRSVVDLSTGTFALRDGAFALLGEAQGIAYTGQPPLPGFPELSASLASATMNMSMTFGKAGELAPMALAMSMEDLVLDEAIWGMFDPTGAIPRQPATLRIDLGAEALWMSDSFGTALQNEQPPFIPQSMELRDLFLTFGGASFAATGEGILSAQTGQPSGTAQMELNGVLSLIDTLSQIGLIPVAQAMMARGMLPQFTRPGPDGPDHLISDIEAMPDGSIFVNGTRVK